MNQIKRKLREINTPVDYAVWILLAIEQMGHTHLKYVYEELVPEEKKPLFREAVDLVMDEMLKQEKISLILLDRFFYLIGYTESIKSLQKIVPLVQKVRFAGSNIYYSAFLNVSVFLPDEVAKRVCHQLIELDNFPRKYILFSLRFLIKSEPTASQELFFRYQKIIYEWYMDCFFTGTEFAVNEFWQDFEELFGPKERKAIEDREERELTVKA